MMIMATPASSGRNTIRSSMRWVSSSEAPKNAAAEPRPASPIATQSHGALRSSGGWSSKVRTTSRSAIPPTPATIQNSGRHAPAPACTPPTTGPAATAPNTHRFMTTPVHGIFDGGQPVTSGGTAAISIKLVVSPCNTWPAIKSPGVGASAASTEPITNSVA